MIVKTHGVVEYTDKQGRLQKREGAVYLHFLEECLKGYFPNFKYDEMQVPNDTANSLQNDERQFLQSLGIKF